MCLFGLPPPLIKQQKTKMMFVETLVKDLMRPGLKGLQIELSMVQDACRLSTQRLGQEDCCEFGTSLGYRM